MKPKSELMESIMDYVEMNNHFKDINSLKPNVQNQYHYCLDSLAKFIRQVRRHEQTKEFKEQKLSGNGEDLAGSIITVMIHLTNNFDRQFIKELPIETQNLFFELADQFGVLLEEIDPNLKE